MDSDAFPDWTPHLKGFNAQKVVRIRAKRIKGFRARSAVKRLGQRGLCHFSVFGGRRRLQGRASANGFSAIA
jgi:hypothetical protein